METYNNINWKSRKLWIAIIFLVTGVAFLILKTGEITFEEWSGYTSWIFFIYIASNSLSKVVEDTISNWKSKKFLGLVVLYLIGVVLIITKQATFIQWAAYTQSIYGVYAAGNVGSKFANQFSFVKNDDEEEEE